MAGFKSDFMRIVHERGMVHQCSDAARLDELLASGIRTAYIGFDCTADSLHVGASAADHAAALVAEDRPQADRADGRRHDQGRRSLGPRRDAPAAHDRADRRQHGEHQEELRQLPEVRQRPDRRGDGQQRRLARHAALHSAAARCRPALLGQPHADHGFGEAPARARPAAHLPRIQLHDPAVLRLRGALQAPQLHPADGRLGPVGQHRHGRRSRPPHGGRRAVRADLAAARHRLGRQDGQDRRRRGVAQPRARSAPTISGNTGATPRTPMSAASSRSSPICRSTRSRGSRRWAARRSTRPRRSSPPRSPRWRMARQRPSRPPRPRAAPSRKAPRPTRCPPSTCRARGSPPASRPSSCCTRRDWRKAAPRRAS